MRDQLLRDQIIAGMSDLKLSERLQMEQDLTVEKVVERVRASEQVKQQAQEMRASSTSLETPATVNAVRQRPGRYNFNRRPTVQRPTVQTPGPQTFQKSSRVPANWSSHQSQGNSRNLSGPQQTCGRCGQGQHAQYACPALQARCRKSNRKGHWQTVCRTVLAAEAGQDPQEYEQYEDYDNKQLQVEHRQNLGILTFV